MVRTTGLWLSKNSNMGATPDGLIYASIYAKDPVGVVEVVSILKLLVKITKEDIRHRFLSFLDKENYLKRSPPYWQQVQGEIHAVGVEWYDFFVWTPHNLFIETIQKDPNWIKDVFAPSTSSTGVTRCVAKRTITSQTASNKLVC